MKKYPSFAAIPTKDLVEALSARYAPDQVDYFLWRAQTVPDDEARDLRLWVLIGEVFDPLIIETFGRSGSDGYHADVIFGVERLFQVDPENGGAWYIGDPPEPHELRDDYPGSHLRGWSVRLRDFSLADLEAIPFGLSPLQLVRLYITSQLDNGPTPSDMSRLNFSHLFPSWYRGGSNALLGFLVRRGPYNDELPTLVYNYATGNWQLGVPDEIAEEFYVNNPDERDFDAYAPEDEPEDESEAEPEDPGDAILGEVIGEGDTYAVIEVRHYQDGRWSITTAVETEHSTDVIYRGATMDVPELANLWADAYAAATEWLNDNRVGYTPVEPPVYLWDDRELINVSVLGHNTEAPGAISVTIEVYRQPDGNYTIEVDSFGPDSGESEVLLRITAPQRAARDAWIEGYFIGLAWMDERNAPYTRIDPPTGIW